MPDAQGRILPEEMQPAVDCVKMVMPYKSGAATHGTMILWLDKRYLPNPEDATKYEQVRGVTIGRDNNNQLYIAEGEQIYKPPTGEI